MKKYMTVAALLAAGTAFSNAEDIVSLLPESTTVTQNLTSGTHNTTLGGYTGSAIQAVTATDVYSELADLSGWVVGCGTKNNTLGTKGSNTVSNGDSGATLTLNNASTAFRGVYMALVVDLRSYDVTGLEISFSAPAFAEGTTTTAGTFSVWTLADSAAFNLVAETALSGLSSGYSSDIDMSDVSADKVVFLFSLQNADAWKAITVSDFTANATLAAVPEPSAFGLLAGVGALALVAARRRRTK